jgi:hypothetical protein
MRKIVREWKGKLDRTPPGDQAMLLHSLADGPKKRADNLKRRSRL